MKITKSTLSRIINEELTRVLRENERGKKRLADRGPHIGGGVSKTRSGHFDYDEGEDEVFEGEESSYKRDDDRVDEGPTLGAASFPKRDDEESEIVEGGNDDWIQAADRDIERRGTKGRCTGAKFGSESCPKGSKEYNLAKTFKKMARDRKK